MRTATDRHRPVLSFEVVGLLLVTPIGGCVFDLPMHDIGIVAVVSATIAMLWNYAYNVIFDHAMLRVSWEVRKTPAIRVVHAVLFEAGLLAILMPFIAWYLGITLLQAFLMDVSFALFYLVYAFFFNWAYDLVFPLATLQGAAPQGVEGHDADTPMRDAKR